MRLNDGRLDKMKPVFARLHGCDLRKSDKTLLQDTLIAHAALVSEHAALKQKMKGLEEEAAKSVALTKELAKARAVIAKMKDLNLNRAVNQPSGKKAEFDKGKTGKKGKQKKRRRRRKRGGKRKGAGNRSKKELVPNREMHTPLDACPDCGTDLSDIAANDVTAKRIIEDIEPPAKEPVVTAETRDRKRCPCCGKLATAKSALALEGCDIGVNAMARTIFLWVGPCLSMPNIVKYLKYVAGLNITASGIWKQIRRISKIFGPVVDEILEDIKKGFKLWADETGWRVDGETWWLWAFANETSAFYHASPSRGSNVIHATIGELFFGVLITVAWGADNKLKVLLRQTCMAHIIRKIKAHIADNPDARSLLRFRSALKRILTDGVKLQGQGKNLDTETFVLRYDRLLERLDNLLEWPNPDPVLAKVIAIVARQKDKILSFVWAEGVPTHNNYGEYIIRKGVLKRKVSGGSMSEDGAHAYAVFISIFQTCLLRGIDFNEFFMTSLRNYMRTGKVLLLSEYAAANPAAVGKKAGTATKEPATATSPPTKRSTTASLVEKKAAAPSQRKRGIARKPLKRRKAA